MVDTKVAQRFDEEHFDRCATVFFGVPEHWKRDSRNYAFAKPAQIKYAALYDAFPPHVEHNKRVIHPLYCYSYDQLDETIRRTTKYPATFVFVNPPSGFVVPIVHRAYVVRGHTVKCVRGQTKSPQ